jgi:hypothetical protein
MRLEIGGWRGNTATNRVRTCYAVHNVIIVIIVITVITVITSIIVIRVITAYDCLWNLSAATCLLLALNTKWVLWPLMTLMPHGTCYTVRVCYMVRVRYVLHGTWYVLYGTR